MITINMQYFGDNGAASGKSGGAAGGANKELDQERKQLSYTSPIVRTAIQDIETELKATNALIEYRLKPISISNQTATLEVVYTNNGKDVSTGSQILINSAALGGELKSPKMFTRIGTDDWKRRKTIKSVVEHI